MRESECSPPPQLPTHTYTHTHTHLQGASTDRSTPADGTSPDRDVHVVQQVVAAPYTSQHALSKCVGNSLDGLECPGLEDLEQSFDEFMQRRNLTMFFMGQVGAQWTPCPRKLRCKAQDC